MFTGLLIFLLGLFAGAFGSLVGLGGGVFIVPGLLLLGDHLDSLHYIVPRIAVGTSVLVIIFAAASSTLTYAKQNKVDFKSGVFFYLASGPGSILGAYMNTFLTLEAFHFIFGSILLVIFYFLIRKKGLKPLNIRWHVTRQITDQEGKLYEFGYHKYLAIAICLFVGVLQGMLGIGGGSLLVPAMILLFWYPTHMAIATSMFVILLSSITGSISHILLGNVDWVLLLWLAPAAWIGGRFGATLSHRFNSRWLTNVLRVMIILLAFHAIWQGLSIHFSW
jgi:uncharacterized membrane protein YfcA